MSALDRLVKELQSKGGGGKPKQHTQTVSLDEATHSKLVELAESLQVSKTALASRLLTASIEDMSTTILTPKQVMQAQVIPVVSSPLSTPPSQNPAPGRSAKHRQR
jgi:hypothetical protein